MKLKQTLILIIIMNSSILFSQNIEWLPSQKLTFANFKGNIPEDSKNTEAAGSMVGIQYTIISTSIWTGKINIKISAFFDSEKSWVKKEFLSDYLLNHEQKHFDIAEAFKLKLQKIVDKEIKGTKDYNNKFQKIYEDIYSQYYEFQNKYDIETNHGKNIEKQKEYDILITKMLE